MRLLAHADLQAADGGLQCFHDRNVPLQRYRVQKFYADLYNVYREHKCDGLIDAGDTMDDRKSIALPTIQVVLTGLQTIGATHAWRVTGNHDQWQKQSDTYHNGRMFDSVFDTESGVGVRKLPDDTGHLVLASFPTIGQDIERDIAQAYERAIKQNPWPVYLIGHFTVAGAQLNGSTAEHGVSKKVLELFSLCLLGDIHKPQQLAKNAWYIGSPFPQDFGEAGEDKRVAILDTNKAAVEWVPTQGFPQYYTVGIDEFLANVRENSEDRYKIVLKSSEEFERYCAHPLAYRHETSFAYTAEQASTEEKEVVPVTDWSVRSAIKRYVEAVPPASKGIEYSADEMEAFGVSIAESS